MKFANNKGCPSFKEGKCCFPHRKDVPGKGPAKPSAASPVVKKKTIASPKKAAYAKGKAIEMEVGSAAGGDSEGE